MVVFAFAVLPVALAASAARAGAGGSVALVIGNSDYRRVMKLADAAGDARAFRRESEQRGFQVAYRENADRHAMNEGPSAISPARSPVMRWR